MRMCPILSLCLLLLLGCVREISYETPVLPCESGDDSTIRISDLRDRYTGETMRIREDLTLRARVISSDEAGNFFGILHLQDAAEEPLAGLQLHLDLRDSHLFYPPGSEILIRLKGLYFGKSAGAYRLGGGADVFGNLSVSRLPAAAVAMHIFPGCEAKGKLLPRPVEIPELHDSLLNTLVRLEEVQFKEVDASLPFAPKEEEAIRLVSDCQEHTIGLLTSGYADFHSEILPEGMGSITGVLQKENNRYVLVIRDLADISFSPDACPDLRMTSDHLFISELADPDNHPEARFLELFFAGDTNLNLLGWTLVRYTNEQTEPGTALDLSGQHLDPGSTLLIAADSLAFESVFGFSPDLESTTNGPADSNGDDNLVLIDPFGKVVDIFGRIGEDGSGTEHEFEDGRAIRKGSVTRGNPEFSPIEWQIFNDTGLSGTIGQPQFAPQDFNPGVHGLVYPQEQ